MLAASLPQSYGRSSSPILHDPSVDKGTHTHTFILLNNITSHCRIFFPTLSYWMRIFTSVTLNWNTLASPFLLGFVKAEMGRSAGGHSSGLTTGERTPTRPKVSDRITLGSHGNSAFQPITASCKIVPQGGQPPSPAESPGKSFQPITMSCKIVSGKCLHPVAISEFLKNFWRVSSSIIQFVTNLSLKCQISLSSDHFVKQPALKLLILCW